MRIRYCAAFRVSCFLLLAALATPQGAFAVMAYPYPVPVLQKDGTTVILQQHGDEYYHWATTGDGYDVAQGPDGNYYFAQTDAAGRPTLSKYRARNASQRDAATRAFLGAHPRSTAGLAGRSLAMAARMANKSPNGLTAAELRSRFSAHAPQTRATVAQPKFLVILANFKDVKFTNPASSFNNMLNLPGYNDNNAIGSARDYFSDNSGGTFIPNFVVVGPVELPQTMAYYGADTDTTKHGSDINPRQMATDAVTAADKAGVDFSQFVDMPDNNIAAIMIVYAGGNQADGSGPADSVWPHESYFASNTKFDGATLNAYACSSELANWGSNTTPVRRLSPIGTFCHEYGHTLGLPDLYDVDYDDNGQGPGLGTFSVMSSGNYNGGGTAPAAYSSVERSLLGWNVMDVLAAGTTTVQPVQNNHSYVAYTAYSPYEYFIFENRQTSYKWDSYILTGSRLGNPKTGGGLVVYHIDRSNRVVPGSGLTAGNLWNSYINMVNAYANHQCALMLGATINSDATNFAPGYFPGPSNITALPDAPTSALNLLDWSGGRIGLQIANIHQMTDGSGNVGFDVSASPGSPVVTEQPMTTIVMNDTYKVNDVAALSVNSPVPLQPSDIAWYFEGTALSGNAIQLIKTGTFRIKAVCNRSNGSTEVMVKYITVTN